MAVSAPGPTYWGDGNAPAAAQYGDHLDGVPAADGNYYPTWVANDAATGKFWGSMSKGDYDAWLLEQQSAREARDYTARREDTAMQRKVADYVAAGFSPLAALEGNTGGQAQSAQVARAASHPSSGGFADKIIPALIMAFGAIASKGLSTASSAANAQELEAVKQANRLAVEKMRATAAMERIAVKAEDARSLAEMREAGNMARAEMRAQSAREATDARLSQIQAQRDIAKERETAADLRQAYGHQYDFEKMRYKAGRKEVTEVFDGRGNRRGYKERWSHNKDYSHD